MGRGRDRRINPRPMLEQNGHPITPQALQSVSGHICLHYTIRFAEALGKGPRMVRLPREDMVDIGWVFNPVPEGLDEDKVSPDLTIRIQFLKEPLGAVFVDHFFGPNCPDATKKEIICQDTKLLVKIELGQKGKLLKEGPK